MKIMIINPDCGVTEEAMALRCRILQQYVAQDTEIYMACPQNSGVEINSALDVALAAPEIVNIAVDAQNAGFDAVVLYCFSDPAIDACREALRIPVIGGAQAACLSALNVCRSFGVMLADELRLPEKKRFLRTLGVDPSCIAQIAAADMRGVDPWQNRELALARLAECGQQMVTEGAEAIVLGCLSFCRRMHRRKHRPPESPHQQNKLSPALYPGKRTYRVVLNKITLNTQQPAVCALRVVLRLPYLIIVKPEPF